MAQIDLTGYDLILAPNAWSNGNGTAAKYSGNFPSYPSGDACVMTAFDAAEGYLPNDANGYIEFNTHRAWIRTPITWNLSNASIYTVDMWYRHKQTNVAQYLWANYADGNNNTYALVNANSGGGANEVHFYCGDASWRTDVILSDNTLYHIVFVKNGATLSVYVNGTITGYDSYNGTYSGGNRNLATLDIGSLAAPENGIIGKILWFGVSTTVAFDATRVAANYAAGASGGYTANNTGDMMALEATVNEPVITPSTGLYGYNKLVTITCTLAGANIYYTTDGSIPTSASTLYVNTFNVLLPKTVKAVAVKSGLLDSSVATVVYSKLRYYKNSVFYGDAKQNYAPIILSLPSGITIMNWLNLGSDYTNDGIVMEKKSNDGGATWSDATVVIADDNHLLSCVCHKLWYDESDGYVHRIWSSVDGVTVENTLYHDKTLMSTITKTSTDVYSGATEMDVGFWFCMPQSELIIKKYAPHIGRYVLSCETFDQNLAQYGSYIYSDDNGVTWSGGGTTPKTAELWSEPSCCEDINGDLVAIVRRSSTALGPIGNFLYTARSTDGGETFGTISVTDIKSPVHHAKITPTDDDRYLIMWNNRSIADIYPRNPMTLAFFNPSTSTINTSSVQDIALSLNPSSDNFSNGNVYFDKYNQQIYVMYEWDQTTDLYISKFSYNYFLTGTPQTPIDLTGYDLILAPNAWSKGNGTIAQYNSNIPSYPSGIDCIMTSYDSTEGYIPNNKDGYIEHYSHLGFTRCSIAWARTETSKNTIELWYQHKNNALTDTYLWGNYFDASRATYAFINRYGIANSNRITYYCGTAIWRTDVSLVDGELYHLVFIKDGIDLKVYVNGELAGYDTYHDTYTNGNSTLISTTDFGSIIAPENGVNGRIYWAGISTTIAFDAIRVATNYVAGPTGGYIGINTGNILSLRSNTVTGYSRVGCLNGIYTGISTGVLK